MSLAKKLTASVDLVVQDFISKIALGYNIDQKELQELWNTNSESRAPRPTSASSSQPITVEDLSTLSARELSQRTTAEALDKTFKVKDLRDACRAKGLKSSTKKELLISALLSEEEGTCASDKKPAASSIKSAFTGSKPPPVSNFMAKYEESIVISKNKFGNYEHLETHLVSNGEKMIGRQDPSGKVLPLSKEDINTCKRLNIEYAIPKNLDDGTELVTVEGEGEEEGEEDEVEVEEEVELEDDEEYDVDED